MPAALSAAVADMFISVYRVYGEMIGINGHSTTRFTYLVPAFRYVTNVAII